MFGDLLMPNDKKKVKSRKKVDDSYVQNYSLLE